MDLNLLNNNHFHTFSIAASKNDYELFSFVHDGKILKDAPCCGMTLRKAGSMRFRWDEVNPSRDKMLSKINSCIAENKALIAPLELIHSHIVYDISSPLDTKNKTGDGMITIKPDLMPVVTVADCMPLFLYDRVTGVYGIVHSGWKGTGIAVDAITLAEKNYGSKAEDFSVILGPHINDCCYIVNEERAEFFRTNFTPECVSDYVPKAGEEKIKWDNGGGKLYRLSLLKANLYALLKAGVREENISYCVDCTACNTVFGSNRRETMESKNFTVQAAFISGHFLQAK